MLDDIGVLRSAAEAYRTAAMAAGISWPDRPGQDGMHPPDLAYRIFDVDQIPEQLIWLESQGWDSQRLFPNGAWLMPWPTDADESFENLSFSIGTPFPWRRQMPLFTYEEIGYTFVLEGDHEGEVWRYEADPDTWGSVRAAPSLAALFTQWTNGIRAGLVGYEQLDGWLHVADDASDPFEALLERAPDLDPFAFPISTISNEPLLRERQRECGVDMDCIERGPDCHEELLSAIENARASLGR